MAKKFNENFWSKLQREWVRLYKRGAAVADLKKKFGEMLAQEESDPLPPPPPPPPPPPEP